MTVDEVYKTASRALIEKTDSLSWGESQWPVCGNGRAQFLYAQNLLGWVLESPGLADTDRARQCFDALCLLGIAYAVSETFAWTDARRAWEKEYNEIQAAVQRETI